MRVTSRIPINTCGKLSGTRNGNYELAEALQFAAGATALGRAILFSMCWRSPAHPCVTITFWAGIGAGKPASARASRMVRLVSKYTCQ